MIFVLDNYDSFTYNLVQYIGELGYKVVVKRNDQTSLDEIEQLAPQRIVISPGPCTPQESGTLPDAFPFSACASDIRPSAPLSEAMSSAPRT
jgi:anthranilate/para-aminobenzoate synthase component II